MWTWRAKLDAMFQRLNYIEVPIVEKVVRLSQPRPLRTLTRVINFLYDGWIYLPPVLFLLFWRQWRLLAATGLAVAVCFALYFLLKDLFARTRPCNLPDVVLPQPR